MSERIISEQDRAGIWIEANPEGGGPPYELPNGTFAAIVAANGKFFLVDTAGNVRGDPCAVEREALALGIDTNLVARGIIGLARLALRQRTGGTLR